ncbi:hypothetical protein [Capnocytophaga canimorsus]|uniref:hypothetical protein n=1 Tax=Capnocytophaga canimorsus TaxID=28188 RepID=UPI000F4E84D9|nr:hypothetical protein [Capnocytophaga canimorsus]MDT9499301.1 hypothetical protein [Capnocytophaga canimorsus]
MKILRLFICLLLTFPMFSQHKKVEYTDEKGWNQKIIYYLSNKGEEYARVYASLDKNNKKQDSLIFGNSAIKKYTLNGDKYNLTATFDLERLVFEGDYLLLKYINPITNWEDLLYDNKFIKIILGDKENIIKPNTIIFEKDIYLSDIFGRNQYCNICSGSGLPYGDNQSYEKIDWVKIKFNSQKKPVKMELFFTKNKNNNHLNNSDYYYIREYFYDNNKIINKIHTTLKYVVNNEEKKYIETYKVFNHK